MITSEWQPANHGTGKRMWFLIRSGTDLADCYHFDKRGQLVRYKSHETALRAATRLNRGL